MAPRTSASALGMTFVKEELEPEEKLAQVAKEENWGSEQTEKRQEEEKGEKNALRLTLETMSINKSQVNLVNFKLPLGLSLKRGRSSQDCSGKDERELKRVKIQNDGQELVVNCDIGKPRCLLCRLNMASAEALRYHNLVRHGDLTSIHTLVSPSKATASAPTSPSKALILDHHKRLSLPSLDGRLPARRVRVKVMREVETLTDVGRAALEERLVENPKEEITSETDLQGGDTRSNDGGLLTDAGFVEDLLNGVGDVKQEELTLSESLNRVLDHLAVLDKGNIFKEPVDLEETPDYLACIPNPMDFSTMRTKVEEEEYTSIETFEEDFLLVVTNCLTYNEEDTKFWRAARRIKKLGLAVIEDSKRGTLTNKPSERTRPVKVSKDFKSRKSKPTRVKSKEKSADCLTSGAPKSTTLLEPHMSRKMSESPSDSGVSLTSSSTAQDSDNSATSSEFAVPTAPRRKSSRPGGPKKPEIVQPMEGEFTGRRLSQRSYGGEKPFMCNHCPLTFSNNDSKVCHERTHTEKKMECPFCEMRFCVETSLRKHSKIHEKQLASDL